LKKIILILSGLIFLLNSVFWILISPYTIFNFALSSANLFFTVVILLWVSGDKFSDGYKIGGGSLILVLGTVRFFLALFSPYYFENNIILLSLIIILVIEIILSYIFNVMSKQGKLTNE